ncbi:MAG: NADP-dependent phosphogluconate dehydrogenase, partial [Pseudomonadota bacterium]
RSDMLDDMSAALTEDPARSLLFAPDFTQRIKETEAAFRKVVSLGALNGIAMPALSAALAYVDTLRTARGTANMLQGQRDFFGAHGFGRIDKDGQHHGPWGAH